MDSVLRLVFPLEGQKCQENSQTTEDDGLMESPIFSSEESSCPLIRKQDDAAKTKGQVCLVLSQSKELRDPDTHLQSLLLQALVTTCGDKKTVLFISTRAAMDESLFSCPDGGDLPVMHRMSAFQRTQHAPFARFVFPKTGRELCRYLAALGALAARSSAQFPDVILINSMETFCKIGGVPDEDEEDGRYERQEESSRLTKVLSLIRHLSAVCTKPLQVLVSLSPRFPVPSLRRLHLFADEVWLLQTEEGLPRTTAPMGQRRQKGEKQLCEEEISLEVSCVSVQPVCRIRFKGKRRRRSKKLAEEESSRGRFNYFPLSMEQDLE